MSALAESTTADYDGDFYAWTQEQAKRLRSLRAAGRLPNDLDIDNIAEEIESLGRSDLSAVESQLTNVFSHLIKTVSAPASPSNSHWQAEGIVFARDMQRRYSRSMRRKVNVQYAWITAREAARVSLEAHGQRLLSGLPEQCPFSVDELFETDAGFANLGTMLAGRLTNES